MSEHDNDKIVPFPGKQEEKPSKELIPWLQKIRKITEMFVVFSAATRQPFLVCDEENFHDQVWIYEKKEDAEKRIAELTEEKQKVMLIAVQNKDFLGFYSSLYSLGIDTVVFYPLTDSEEKERIEIELGFIVIKPNYEKLPEKQRPVFNPQMQLTGLYFMQEYHRGVPNSEKPELHELEEEAVSALAKSRLLLPILQREDQSVAAPLVKGPDGNNFQPLFTDLIEFKKYDPKGQLKVLTIPFAELDQAILDTVKGIVVNPGGFCMAVNRDKLAALKEKFL